jgi:hypothetical protein
MPGFFQKLRMVLAEHVSAVLACFLAFYAVASAIVMPRLFAGDATVHVPIQGVITEVPLAPTNGNITQTAYLLTGIASFFALRIWIHNSEIILAARRAFFAFIVIHMILGLADLGGKISGTGDWLSSLRTAGYAMLIDTEVSGFWRITGGCSEASAFAGLCLSSIAFTYTYWRETQSTFALALTTALFILIIFSTSSTAYIGTCFLMLVACVSIGRNVLCKQFHYGDLIIFLALIAMTAICLCLYLCDEHLFDPFYDLIHESIFNKANSASGQERSYWNEVGLSNFIDTYGLGVGMGSSRTSAWFLSVLSQLGVFGVFLFAGLFAAILNGAGRVRVPGQPEVYALISSVRAFAIGSFAAGSIAGSGADPGFQFFLSLGIILACKHHLKIISQSIIRSCYS